MPLTFIPSSFPLSINSSILFLSSDWVEGKKNKKYFSILSWATLGSLELPQGYSWLASMTSVPKDAHVPTAPSVSHCPSVVDNGPPGAQMDQEGHSGGPNAELGWGLCSIWHVQSILNYLHCRHVKIRTLTSYNISWGRRDAVPFEGARVHRVLPV